MTVKCSDRNCDARAAVAIRTKDAGLRGITSTVYYDVAGSVRGSDPKCRKHAAKLLIELMGVLDGSPR